MKNFDYFKRAFWFAMTRFQDRKVRTIAFRKLGFEVGERVYLAPRINMTVGIADRSIRLKIGDRAAIGPNTTFILATHPCDSKLHKILTFPKREIIIGDDTWVGANVIIMPGVTIGKCCIIGAGAVVTHDVPDYSVVAGVPARVIKTIDPILVEM